jgi:LPS O-antigen subunit length determinant protein (WzzB/FepE family)
MKLEKENNSIDNIPFIEILLILWNEKKTILSITLLFIISSLIYSYTKAQEPSVYKVMIRYESSNNLELSINLLQAISKKINPNTHLSTTVTIKYAPTDSPYSPMNLFLRFSEKLTSIEFKNKYTERAKLSATLEKTIKNITTSYPKNKNIPFLIAESSFTPDENNSIEKHKESINNYFSWAKTEFIRQTMQQTGIASIEYDFIYDYPVRTKQTYPKENTYSLLILSTIFGLMMGVIVITIKKVKIKK